MADAAAFDWTCAQLEERTNLDRLEARGTVRIALKQAGLDARSVTPDQMKVVLERILPGELGTRGIDDGNDVCSAIIPGLARIDAPTPGESPDEVFRRLGGQ